MFAPYTFYIVAAYGITLGVLLVAFVLVFLAWRRAPRRLSS